MNPPLWAGQLFLYELFVGFVLAVLGTELRASTKYTSTLPLSDTPSPKPFVLCGTIFFCYFDFVYSVICHREKFIFCIVKSVSMIVF
jgi:hypothetical protein